MTPVSSPVNTLVLGPGNYSFSDFVKLGGTVHHYRDGGLCGDDPDAVSVLTRA